MATDRPSAASRRSGAAWPPLRPTGRLPFGYHGMAMKTNASSSQSAQAGFVRALTLVLLLAVALAGLYLAVVLNWSYSEGERAGVLQKFSRRGWVFKTYEGELAMTTVPGTAPIIWSFSARDEDVAARLRDALGKKVVLHYEEHRGVPTTWFAETDFWVTAVHVTE